MPQSATNLRFICEGMAEILFFVILLFIQT